MSTTDTSLRWLPAGDSRSLPTLDAVVDQLNATAGTKAWQVVYAARGDKFKVVPVSKPDQIQYRTDLGEAA
ncbi:hypothetical protein [Streptomyces olivaceiscleroticus]|uniref:Uncharacterized protein n=1 Tax=Streptomyces olivaceiscleroticus TaxID=68245 RepID=A0ABP3LI74_9ACTN